MKMRSIKNLSLSDYVEVRFTISPFKISILMEIIFQIRHSLLMLRKLNSLPLLHQNRHLKHLAQTISIQSIQLHPILMKESVRWKLCCILLLSKKNRHLKKNKNCKRSSQRALNQLRVKRKRLRWRPRKVKFQVQGKNCPKFWTKPQRTKFKMLTLLTATKKIFSFLM